MKKLRSVRHRGAVRRTDGPQRNWNTTTTAATTSRRWTNPPAVYEVPMPSTHSTKRITATVHSMTSPSPSVLCSYTPFLPWNLSRTAHPGSAGGVSIFDQSARVAADSLISIGDHDVKSTGELFDVLLESLADALRTAASATPSFARSSGPSASSRRPSWLPSRVRPVLLVEDDPTEASRSEGSLEPAGRPMDR